jgi:hypothetical protein
MVCFLQENATGFSGRLGGVPNMGSNKEKRETGSEGGSPPRIALHVAIAVVGWALFVYFWRVVGERGLSAGAVLSLVAMAVFLAAVIISTTLWIAHNLRISRFNRRKGNRAVPELPYIKDKIGHTVESEGFDSLRRAPFIEVAVEDEKKIYRSVRHTSDVADKLSG